MLTRFSIVIQSPKRGITLSVFYRIHSKINQVVYTGSLHTKHTQYKNPSSSGSLDVVLRKFSIAIQSLKDILWNLSKVNQVAH